MKKIFRMLMAMVYIMAGIACTQIISEPTTTEEYRLVVAYENYDIRYQLEQKLKVAGWWKREVSFTQTDIANQYGDITEETVDMYIEESLGYLPDYYWEENPHDPSDIFRERVKSVLQRLLEYL